MTTTIYGQRESVRRNLLILSLACIALLVTYTGICHIPRLSNTSKGWWELLETQTIGLSAGGLRSDIETKYGVRIEGPESSLSFINFIDEKLATQKWDAPRLKGLESVLAELPPYFYSPREIKGSSYKLSFALINEDDFSHCACSSEDDLRVVLAKKSTEQTIFSQPLSRKTIVHEITHSVVTPHLDRYVKSILEPVGIKDKEDIWKLFSPKFTPDLDEVASITLLTTPGVSAVKTNGQVVRLGKNVAVELETLSLFGEKNIKYIAVKNMHKKYPEVQTFEDVDRLVNPAMPQNQVSIIDIPTYFVELQGKSGYDNTRLAHGTMNLNEFLAIGAEFYVQGKNKFSSVYTPVIGPILTDKFYSGIKEQLFLGKEYN